ncbi:hypothetical protein MKY34_10775 [Sporosarcina sp. FSL K6-1522]|uniref:hypothetical protein n=1 Tax=Sporosarcina sp. FSL K6-1522 TaxID=2921554 RepID=UPI00315A0BEA
MFNTDTLLLYFPAIILLFTLEIILTACRSDDVQWTRTLAVCNLIVNFSWVTLLLVMVSNPNLFNPEFAPTIARTYNYSLTTATAILYFIGYSIVLAVVITNIIDTFTGFSNCKFKKKRDSF